MPAPTVIHDRRDGYHVLTLNRPDRLNAFNDELHAALREALASCAAEDECRAVVLTGAGRGFCAGQDLSNRVNMGDERPDLGATLEANYNPLVRAIRALPKPVICAVNGVAAGAGANIALACDIVIAAKSAKFIQAFSKIGLVPDSGGTWFLPRLLGEARAKGLALTAQPLSADDAERWGLIWKVVDDADLMAEAEAQARAFADGPTAAYALTKQAIHAAGTNTLDQQLDLERDYQRQAGFSDDYKEGVAAFMEKRKPDYRKR
ncbi:MAG: 2-(1,2-epoxy-1,2-dihydrophenyl)acetyl-CoA isomerase [Rhizobiales bacterium]|nr:2-(1,2-epoxy-1,2-dihydrophenyl)acetyl-CoA isomerase [Hyphomicrobiales bacterium]OJU33277.1 MAG: 2-(1,2-epoxy-1,2-dihydrophenyl)acetyl-CoA isomerase [Rhizobiales bacterium 68-8]